MTTGSWPCGRIGRVKIGVFLPGRPSGRIGNIKGTRVIRSRLNGNGGGMDLAGAGFFQSAEDIPIIFRIYPSYILPLQSQHGNTDPTGSFTSVRPHGAVGAKLSRKMESAGGFSGFI